MDVRRWQGMIVVVALTLFGAWACAQNAAQLDEDGAVICTDDNDCVAGTACEWKRCRPACTLTSDCPSPLHCHPRGVCTECAAQVDCDANTYCFRGSCLDGSELDSDVRFGVACESLDQCLNGEICLAGRCTSLCQTDEECRPPRGLCHPEHFCVQCIEHSDCQSGSACLAGRCEQVDEPVACESPCDAAAGTFCNEALGECQEVRCMSCDKDSDCTNAERCRADRAVNGDRICVLVDATICPSGYALDDENVCRPQAMCVDLTYSGVTQACRFPGDLTQNACAKGLRCLFNSRVSFCSPPCETQEDCEENFPEGCCGSFSGGQSYCLTPEFCALLDD